VVSGLEEMAKRNTVGGGEVWGGRLRQNENVEENHEKRLDQKAVDTTAGSIRRQSVTQE